MSASFDDIPDSPVRGGLSSSVVGMKVVCIRCGSTEHSTREHDEGRIGDAAEGQTPQVEKLSTWEKKQRATEAYIAAGRAVHALSWKNHFQNKATIPDIVEPRDPLCRFGLRPPYQQTKMESFISRADGAVHSQEGEKKRALAEHLKSKMVPHLPEWNN